MEKKGKKKVAEYRTQTYGAAYDLHSKEGAWDIVLYFREAELEALKEHARRGTNDANGKVGANRVKLYLHKKRFRRGKSAARWRESDYFVTVRLWEGAWGWEEAKKLRHKGEKVEPVKGDIFLPGGKPEPEKAGIEKGKAEAKVEGGKRDMRFVDPFAELEAEKLKKNGGA
jgi:hypothetical protein